MFVEFKKVIRMEKISGWQVASVTQSLFKRTFGGGGGGLRTLGILATPELGVASEC